MSMVTEKESFVLQFSLGRSGFSFGIGGEGFKHLSVFAEHTIDVPNLRAIGFAVVIVSSPAQVIAKFFVDAATQLRSALLAEFRFHRLWN